MDSQHIRILERVGRILLLIGLIDIVVMIYCIVNHISYSSSFNIYAVIAGLFLLCGSLRAASVVRWFSVLIFAASITLLTIWPLIQPFDLIMTQIHLNPIDSLATAAFMIFFLALLLWIIKELGCETVQTARAKAGRKQRDMRIPAAIGVGLVILLGIFVGWFLNNEYANRAKSMAEQSVGSGYHFYVNSLHINSDSQGTHISAVVTAWNNSEIKYIPVHWEE